jgi:hypothetical protein
VTVSTVAGTYTNSVNGAATAQAVDGTGETAPVTVTPILVLQPRFTG